MKITKTTKPETLIKSFADENPVFGDFYNDVSHLGTRSIADFIWAMSGSIGAMIHEGVTSVTDLAKYPKDYLIYILYVNLEGSKEFYADMEKQRELRTAWANAFSVKIKYAVKGGDTKEVNKDAKLDGRDTRNAAHKAKTGVESELQELGNIEVVVEKKAAKKKTAKTKAAKKSAPKKTKAVKKETPKKVETPKDDKESLKNELASL